MVRNGHGTNWFYPMVRNAGYEMVMVRNDYNSFHYWYELSISGIQLCAIIII